MQGKIDLDQVQCDFGEEGRSIGFVPVGTPSPHEALGSIDECSKSRAQADSSRVVSSVDLRDKRRGIDWEKQR